MAATMETIFVDRRACAWELRKVVFVSIVKIVSNVFFYFIMVYRLHGYCGFQQRNTLLISDLAY